MAGRIASRRCPVREQVFLSDHTRTRADTVQPVPFLTVRGHPVIIGCMPDRSSNPRKRPRDPNQLAKLIVDQATGAAPIEVSADDGKNPAAVALGRLGG